LYKQNLTGNAILWRNKGRSQPHYPSGQYRRSGARHENDGFAPFVPDQSRCFPDPQADAMAAGADDILQNAVICSSIDEALHGVVFTVAMTRGCAIFPLR